MMSFKLKFAGRFLAASALAFSGLAAANATCYADTITTFDVSGTFATGTLGGTINLDVTSNAVTSADVTVSGTSPAISGPFTTIENLVEYPSSDHLLYISLSDAPDSDVLVLFLPTSTLTGYAGGDLCSTTYSCTVSAQTYLQTTGPIFENLTSGSLTATPLPAALPLFASGLGALSLLGWRRKRKAQAV
jgi:hypothetical protein